MTHALALDASLPLAERLVRLNPNMCQVEIEGLNSEHVSAGPACLHAGCHSW